MKLEDSLNGGYAGLYGEVVTEDTYKVKNLDFVPECVLDLGCNVGVFSRFARELWPDAWIYSVEPDPENCAVFKEHTKDPKIMLLNNAIGKGDVYRCLYAANGAMQVYLSEGPGYNRTDLDQLKHTPVKGIMLTDLYDVMVGKVLLKLDIEGNETVIFNDPASMAILKTIDYIAIELHYYAADGDKHVDVKRITDEALASLSETHDTHQDHIYFYARKK